MPIASWVTFTSMKAPLRLRNTYRFWSYSLSRDVHAYFSQTVPRHTLHEQLSFLVTECGLPLETNGALSSRNLDNRNPTLLSNRRRTSSKEEREFHFQYFKDQCLWSPDASRVLLEEKLMRHRGKHAPVPTLWENVAGIIFRICLSFQKNPKSLSV